MVARFALSLLLVGAIHGVAFAQSATETLRKSLEARSNTLVTLLQSQPMMGGSAERVIMKVEMDGKGRSRRTMVQPLRLQGQVIIDDGRSMSILVPDQKEHRIIAVVASNMMKVDERMDLIRRNYRLSIESGEVIAGRSTHLIKVRPRHRGIPSRDISVDQKTFLPLRSISKSQTTERLILDTLSFDIPKGMPEEIFTASAPAGYRVRKMAGATRVANESDAAERLSFQPWIPRGLPYGMSVEALEVIGNGKESAFVIRLTDGFNIATLYQWDAQAIPLGLGSIRELGIISNKGLNMALIGDLPDSVMSRMKEHLAKEAQAL